VPIYGLAFDGEIRYVGKTTHSPRTRLRRHVDEAHLGTTHVSRWIRSLPRDPDVVVLEKEHVGSIDEAERAWIALLRRYGCRLTNMTDGGDGQSPGWAPSSTTRRKMSLAGKRRYADPVKGAKGREDSARGGRLLRGITRSPETRAKIAETLRGRRNGPPSAETRDKIGRANTGTKCSCRTSRRCAFCRRGGGA
jgi:hypothetical protein